MSEDILLEPVKAYTSTYKQAVNDEERKFAETDGET